MSKPIDFLKKQQIISSLMHVSAQRTALNKREMELIEEGKRYGVSFRRMSRALGYSESILATRKRRNKKKER